jgi:hypothetical protein
VVISAYNKVKEKQSKDHLLSRNQKDWLRVKLMVFQSTPIQRPERPTGRFSKIRNNFFVVANSDGLDWVINLCIIWRSALLAMQWYNMPIMIEEFVNAMLQGFGYLFVVEAICKIIGNGVKYFLSGWN